MVRKRSLTADEQVYLDSLLDSLKADIIKRSSKEREESLTPDEQVELDAELDSLKGEIIKSIIHRTPESAKLLMENFRRAHHELVS